ncbi:MAG: DUF389 domain-containing protein [Acidimicrobiales bacterium]
MKQDVPGVTDLEEPAIRLNFEPTTLLHPAAVQWLITAVGFAAISIWPERSDGPLSVVVGSAMVAIGASRVLAGSRSRGRRWLEAGMGVLILVLGMAVLVARASDEVTLARLVAAVLVFEGVRRFLVKPVDGTRASVVYPIVLLGAGALIALFPREMLGLLTGILAISAMGTALIVIGELNATPASERTGRSSRSLIADWFEHRPRSVEEREDVYAKVFFEGDSYGTRLGRFFALMGFAAALAALGVVSDSTAVVIGAMLVAPLMTPLMGVAVSLSMGWPHRLARAAAVAAGGALWAISIGVLVGLQLGNFIDVATNSQIQARISPTVIDLLVAMAAGAAGAYGLSRPDVSDSLPGVAIAISLVPPLTVVGICYAQGAVTEGNGALLLFLTNAISIMIVGAITFVLTGQTSMHELAAGQRHVRTAVLALAAMAAVVFAGLFLNGEALVSQAINEGFIRSDVTDWVAGADGYTIADLTINPGSVDVTITGPVGVDPPPTQQLADEIAGSVKGKVDVTVRVIRSELEAVTTEPAG